MPAKAKRTEHDFWREYIVAEAVRLGHPTS